MSIGMPHMVSTAGRARSSSASASLLELKVLALDEAEESLEVRAGHSTPLYRAEARAGLPSGSNSSRCASRGGGRRRASLCCASFRGIEIAARKASRSLSVNPRFANHPPVEHRGLLDPAANASPERPGQRGVVAERVSQLFSVHTLKRQGLETASSPGCISIVARYRESRTAPQ